MHFALANEPVDYQLTVHYNNYIAHYNRDSFLAHLEYVNKYIKGTIAPKEFPLMYGLIMTYGYNKIMQFHINCVAVDTAIGF